MSDSLEIPDKLYFKIGEVASLLKVDAHVLRYWESEMGITPHRSNAGHRIYRKVDIIEFMKIKRLVHDEGYTMAGAKKLLQQEQSKNVSLDPSQIQDVLSQLNKLQTQLHQLRKEILR